MKSYRIPRLQEELKKIFNITLSQKLNDPKLMWVQITDVIISKDLRYAKMYFSHYNNPSSHEKIRELLIKSSGFFKKQIAGAKLMRTIPELTFFYDDTEDRAAKVDTLLSSLKDDFDDDDDYDPDIDLDDLMDEEDYLDFDDDDEEDYEDFEDEDNEEDE